VHRTLKLFIRAKGESRYLTASGTWTNNRSEALNFTGFGQAFDYCHEKKLDDVEALYAYENPEFDFVLTLERRAARPESPKPNR